MPLGPSHFWHGLIWHRTELSAGDRPPEPLYDPMTKTKERKRETESPPERGEHKLIRSFPGFARSSFLYEQYKNESVWQGNVTTVTVTPWTSVYCKARGLIGVNFKGGGAAWEASSGNWEYGEPSEHWTEQQWQLAVWGTVWALDGTTVATGSVGNRLSTGWNSSGNWECGEPSEHWMEHSNSTLNL